MNSHSLLPGFSLVTLSGLCAVTFALPLRLQRRYRWENTWFVGMSCAMVVLPLISAYFLLPHWPTAIRLVGTKTLLTVVGFGFLWGVGTVTFALGVDAVGLSLGYAIIMGIITAIGSIIPMVRRWSDVPSVARIVILLAIAVCLVGVATCGRAGTLRERKEVSSEVPKGVLAGPTKNVPRAFAVGLLWCVISGVLSSCNNLGFDFADRIAEEAQRLGASPAFASLGRWLAVYWGGFVALLIFCGLKMLRTGTWRNYAGSGAGRDFALALMLGSLHFSSQMTYGIGAYYLGRLGTTVGFAMTLAISLVVANLFGFITGEWKNATPISVHTLYLGLGILVLAVVLLAYGNGLATTVQVGQTASNR